MARVIHRIDAWWTAPLPHAAERMGLFRVVYAVFYLWHLSLFELGKVGGLGEHHVQSLLLLEWLPRGLPPAFFQGLDLSLVFALVLLAFGVRVRGVTGFVLVAGVMREAFASGVGVENSNVFLVFYIPFFMLICGTWGERYSVDALQRDAGDVPDWRHAMASRACLVVLAALFTSSPLYKSFLGGTWLSNPDLLANLTLARSIRAETLGFMGNPLAPFLAAHPDLAFPIQLAVLAFEGTFFLVLVGPRLRWLYFSLALAFHALNAVFLMVSFTPVLIIYAMYVDWERLRRLRGVAFRGWVSWTPVRLRWVAVASAAALAAGWNLGARSVPNLWGLLDWRTPWLVIGPLAAAAVVVQLVALIRRRPPPTPAA